ncbi:MAG: cytochrome c oxidase subunit II, partial [Allorhizobium sp.]
MRARMFHRIAFLGVIGLTLTACSGDLSTLDPAGPYAGAIANLWWIMLIGSGLILGLVLALLGLVFFK